MSKHRSCTQAAILLPAIVISLACGCSSDHGSSAPDSDLVHLAITSICSGIQTCCQSRGFPFGDANCNANMHAKFTPEKICPAGYTLDLQAAQDCYAQLRANYASCGTTSAFVDACSHMCQGASATGEVCTSGKDCAQPAIGVSTCYLGSGTSSTGICHTDLRVALGDSCNQTCTNSNNLQMQTCTYTLAAGATSGTEQTRCFTNDGIYCATGNTCQALLPIGAACTNARACQAGAHCGVISSTCDANLELGAACSYSNECDDNSYCKGTTCVSKKPTGQPCGGDNECVGICNETRGLCVDTGGGVAMTKDFCANPAFD